MDAVLKRLQDKPRTGTSGFEIVDGKLVRKASAGSVDPEVGKEQFATRAEREAANNTEDPPEDPVTAVDAPSNTSASPHKCGRCGAGFSRPLDKRVHMKACQGAPTPVKQVKGVAVKAGFLSKPAGKPTTAATPALHCAVCSAPAQKCSGCGLVAYCGREHQKTHWKQHKSDCKAAHGSSSKEVVPAGVLGTASAIMQGLASSGTVREDLNRVQGMLSAGSAPPGSEEDAAVKFLLGIIAFLLGDVNTAVMCLLTSLQMSPSHADRQYFVATLPFVPPQEKQGLLEKVLLSEPGHVAAHIDMQEILQGTGDMLQARLAAQKAVDAGGFWVHPMQRPAGFLPKLRSQPWWEGEAFWFQGLLEERFSVIQGEMKALRAGWTQVGDTSRPGMVHDGAILGSGHWTEAVLAGSDLSTEVQELCPVTLKTLVEIEEAYNCATAGVGEIIFSCLEPGSHLKPHCAASNMALTSGSSALTGVVEADVSSWAGDTGGVSDQSWRRDSYMEGGQVYVVRRFIRARGVASRANTARGAVDSVLASGHWSGELGWCSANV
eukprot:TRINITY_DN13149_c0_g2_i2.p1 TRINITY_DN13149_c0_g2~~TRINITY_DN13149_c0_g2_i2.p1  ORF type:complete len:549 (-),score=117.84 TRINITY_DN13149_c0_g2_i2:387-2033(-)